jgi:ribonuclease VapC
MTSDKPDNLSDPVVQEASSRAAPLGPRGRRAVLEASALLALLFAEPGAETVAEVIADGAVMSSVNLSEVATLLVRHGQDPSKTLLPVLEQVSVEAFTVDDALAAAALSPRAAPNGLSLADRACLALAKRLNAPAVTADRAWSQLDINVAVHLIRP